MARVNSLTALSLFILLSFLITAKLLLSGSLISCTILHNSRILIINLSKYVHMYEHICIVLEIHTYDEGGRCRFYFFAQKKTKRIDFP